jgi:hypothetical protein
MLYAQINFAAESGGLHRISFAAQSGGLQRLVSLLICVIYNEGIFAAKLCCQQ